MWTYFAAGFDCLFLKGAIARWWRAKPSAVRSVLAWLHYHAATAEPVQSSKLRCVLFQKVGTCFEAVPDADAIEQLAKEVLMMLTSESLSDLDRLGACQSLIHCPRIPPLTALPGV